MFGHLECRHNSSAFLLQQKARQLRFMRGAHASHLRLNLTVSRLLRASAICFTSFLRIPPPPAPPALLPPALNRRDSCHFPLIVRPEAALCSHDTWKSRFSKATAAATALCLHHANYAHPRITLTSRSNHRRVFNITVASTCSRPTLRLTSPSARFAQGGSLLRLSGKILCLVPDVFCRSRRRQELSR